MGKIGRIIVFIILCFSVILALAIVRELSGKSVVMWLAVIIIPLLYKVIVDEDDD